MARFNGIFEMRINSVPGLPLGLVNKIIEPNNNNYVSLFDPSDERKRGRETR